MTDESLMDTGADAAGAGLAEGTILKILSGVQSGVEVTLVPGQYTLGSGDDDDIQIIDVSLAPGHLQLRVASRGVQIRAAAGSVRTGNGISLDPNSDWHEIEPLDILTVGTTRLALGPVTAAWTSITDIEEAEAPSTAPEIKPERPGVPELLARIDLRKHGLPLLALVMVLGLAIWYLSSGGDGVSGRQNVTPASVAEVRTVLERMPFAQDISVRQEVDGTIYATGYVDTVVERRAVASAIEEIGVPVHVRIWVLQSMRQEIEGIIEAQKRKVTFDISRKGEVTLNGIIPDDAQAEQFVSTIKESVLGVSGVVSNLRTPSTLLADIEKLAQSSRIKPWVLFRFDNGLIEATGALPAEETDSWSGFLQVYARRFAPDVGLRSLVQLQDINIQSGGTPSHAITIGAPAQNSGDVEVDVSRIQQGNFTPGDVLVGAATDQTTQAQSGTVPVTGASPLSSLSPVVPPATQRQADAVRATTSSKDGGATLGMGALAVRPATEGLADPASAGAKAGDVLKVSPSAGMADPVQAPVKTGDLPPAGLRDSAAKMGLRALPVMPPREKMAPPIFADIQVVEPDQLAQAEEVSSPADGTGTNLSLSDTTRLLIDQWRDGRLQSGANATSLLQALERLNREGGGSGKPSRLSSQQMRDRYLPAASTQVTAENVCWPGSRLRPQDAAAALFWLDILSVGHELSLATFDNANQLKLMEVALNPRRIARCILRAYPDTDVLDSSVFLREIKRNPAFVRFIMRDIASYPLKVSGANPSGDVRFIQTPAGVKINEGASPDDSSRLLTVGELGAVVEVPRGVAALIYGPELVWLLD